MRAPVCLVLVFAFFVSGHLLADGDRDTRGSSLFEQKCASCHSIGGGPRVGPDLQGVHERRAEEWLVRFITQPDRVIAEKDEIALGLVAQFGVVMPNLGLSRADAKAVLTYLQAAGRAAAGQPAAAVRGSMPRPELIAPQSIVLGLFVSVTAVIGLVFAWVGYSTRFPEDVDVKKAYRFRKTLFATASAVLVAVLAVTLPGAPYAVAEEEVDRIVYVAARQFDFVFSDEPITSMADMERIPHSRRLDVPANALVEFRVTSLDVNHGFGVYGPERQLLAQTQAMPGYINRLRVRPSAAGHYKVFCLEYCAAGHHAMQAGFVVN